MDEEPFEHNAALGQQELLKHFSQTTGTIQFEVRMQEALPEVVDDKSIIMSLSGSSTLGQVELEPPMNLVFWRTDLEHGHHRVELDIQSLSGTNALRVGLHWNDDEIVMRIVNADDPFQHSLEATSRPTPNN